MIPTLAGIIIVTFILFNYVPNDPAAMKLGKNATARSKESFDLKRGLDKPAICGIWGKTRAYSDTDFKRNAGPWTRVEGVRWTTNGGSGRIVLPDGGSYAVPFAFQLATTNEFRIKARYRLSATPGSKGAASSIVVSNSSGIVRSVELEPADGFRDASVVFNSGTNPGSIVVSFAVEKGTLEIGQIGFGKKASHFFDSQLLFYLRQLARLDFGESLETNQRVVDMLKRGVLPSLSLTVPMFVAGLMVSIVMSLVCAYFRDTAVDRFFVVLSVLLMSVNYLVWIVLGQFFLGFQWRWFPVWGYESLRYLALPCIIGIVSGLGSDLRFYRTVMLDETYRDYVRTAFAKGVSKRGVLFGHILRNAMIPVVTNVIIAIPFLYTGSLLLESFFGIPGLGAMGVNALNSADFDVIRALVLVGSVIFMVANLATDICYALVDPRIRLK